MPPVKNIFGTSSLEPFSAFTDSIVLLAHLTGLFYGHGSDVQDAAAIQKARYLWQNRIPPAQSVLGYPPMAGTLASII